MVCDYCVTGSSDETADTKPGTELNDDHGTSLNDKLTVSSQYFVEVSPAHTKLSKSTTP